MLLSSIACVCSKSTSKRRVTLLLLLLFDHWESNSLEGNTNAKVDAASHLDSDQAIHSWELDGVVVVAMSGGGDGGGAE